MLLRSLSTPTSGVLYQVPRRCQPLPLSPLAEIRPEQGDGAAPRSPWGEIPAYAGMTARGRRCRWRGVSSTRARRLRRRPLPLWERRGSALARRRWGGIPAYAGMTAGEGSRGDGVGSRFRGNDVAPGDSWRRGATRPVCGALRHRLDSCLRRNDGTGGDGGGASLSLAGRLQYPHPPRSRCPLPL